MADITPLTDNINNGLVGATNELNNGFYNLRQATSNLANGASAIVSNTASGAGRTISAVPACARNVIGNLQRSNGLLRQPLDMLTGRPRYGRRRSPRRGPYGGYRQRPYGGQGPYGPPQRYHQGPPRGHPIRRVMHHRQY